jgi:capsule polysaccharide modification protein KpsS
MVQFREEFHGQGILWTEANVHDVLRYAGSVVTLNSGVGFEALLALKPLVTMARSEYDCVAHRATPDDLTSAWRAALEEGSPQRETRYARFVDWFLGRHAVDISRPHAGRYVLDRIIERALSETEPRP